MLLSRKRFLYFFFLLLALLGSSPGYGEARTRRVFSQREVLDVIEGGREYVVAVIATKEAPFGQSRRDGTSPLRRVGISPDRDSSRPRRSVGSGVVIDSDGYIVTTATLAREPGEISVLLSDGRKLKATVIGTDEPTNISLLKIPGIELLSPVFGNSSSLAEESSVVIVGGRFDGHSSVSLGKIRSSKRVRMVGGGELLPLDTSLFPGTSGAAVFNMDGELVGIASGKLGRAGGVRFDTGFGPQSGFAIPIEKVSEIVKELRASGKVSRGFLGVNIARNEVAVTIPGVDEEEKGAFVLEVLTGSPAERAGIRKGDIIVGVSGSRVDNPQELSSIVAEIKPGTRIRVDLVREGRVLNLIAEVGERPPANVFPLPVRRGERP